ncbi:hypothetical protein GGS21DRAFT_528233 [Xylaria nigripes]|nr:hypothetical protein GGS21DRAFT_528233 [Xylaria nigripes]
MESAKDHEYLRLIAQHSPTSITRLGFSGLLECPVHMYIRYTTAMQSRFCQHFLKHDNQLLNSRLPGFRSRDCYALLLGTVEKTYHALVNARLKEAFCARVLRGPEPFGNSLPGLLQVLYAGDLCVLCKKPNELLSLQCLGYPDSSFVNDPGWSGEECLAFTNNRNNWEARLFLVLYLRLTRWVMGLLEIAIAIAAANMQLV